MFVPSVVNSLLAKYASMDLDQDAMIEDLKQEFAIENIGEIIQQADETKASDYNAKHKKSHFRNKVVAALEDQFQKKLTSTENVKMVDSIARMIYLNTMDKHWVDHISAMENLRDKVGLYGYAQQDPLVMYKQEAYDKFEKLTSTIELEILAVMFRAQLNQMAPTAVTLTQEAQDQAVLLKLQNAAATTPDAPAFDPRVMAQRGFDQTANPEYAKAFGSDDDVEVIDL